MGLILFCFNILYNRQSGFELCSCSMVVFGDLRSISVFRPHIFVGVSYIWTQCGIESHLMLTLNTFILYKEMTLSYPSIYGPNN